MLLACRVNFLLAQAGVAIDPRAERRHREWAEREIDEALRILPTPRQLADVLELCVGRTTQNPNQPVAVRGPVVSLARP
jgi:hypothetical protein